MREVKDHIILGFMREEKKHMINSKGHSEELGEEHMG
jgi:hypothetical protein